MKGVIVEQNKLFFWKKIFRENHLWRTSAAFFEKIVLLENIFYHTSSDAVLPADFEYHLSFALRCYFKGKTMDFGGKKQGFWEPRAQFTLANAIRCFTQHYILHGWIFAGNLISIRLQVFILFEKYDMIHFFQFFLHRGQKVFSKKAFYYISLDAARWADSEYHLAFAPKWCPVCKNRDLGAKTSVFGRLIAPARLISTKSRYAQRWIRHGRIISESLRSIGRKLCRAFTKYGKAGF